MANKKLNKHLSYVRTDGQIHVQKRSSSDNEDGTISKSCTYNSKFTLT